MEFNLQSPIETNLELIHKQYATFTDWISHITITRTQLQNTMAHIDRMLDKLVLSAQNTKAVVNSIGLYYIETLLIDIADKSTRVRADYSFVDRFLAATIADMENIMDGLGRLESLFQQYTPETSLSKQLSQQQKIIAHNHQLDSKIKKLKSNLLNIQTIGRGLKSNTILFPNKPIFNINTYSINIEQQLKKIALENPIPRSFLTSKSIFREPTDFIVRDEDTEPIWSDLPKITDYWPPVDDTLFKGENVTDWDMQSQNAEINHDNEIKQYVDEKFDLLSKTISNINLDDLETTKEQILKIKATNEDVKSEMDKKFDKLATDVTKKIDTFVVEHSQPFDNEIKSLETIFERELDATKKNFQKEFLDLQNQLNSLTTNLNSVDTAIRENDNNLTEMTSDFQSHKQLVKKNLNEFEKSLIEYVDNLKLLEKNLKDIQLRQNVLIALIAYATGVTDETLQTEIIKATTDTAVDLKELAEQIESAIERQIQKQIEKEFRLETRSRKIPKMRMEIEE